MYIYSDIIKMSKKLTSSSHIYTKTRGRNVKKFRKIFTLGLAAIMLGGIFTGCSQELQNKPQKVESLRDKPNDEVDQENHIKLKVVSMFGGSDPNAPIFEDAIEDFMVSNPNIIIENKSDVADETWKSNVLTDFAAGNEPDVIQFFTDINSKTLVEQNKVVSIDEIRSVYPEYGENINLEALEEAACYDGIEYAIPTHGYYEGIFCNKDLFEAKGIELPTDWEKLEKAITAFKGEEIIPIAAALGHIPHYLIENFILAEGGTVEHSNRNIESVKDTWIKGLNYLKKFNDMGAFPADTATTRHELAQAQFIDKQAAMLIDGSWAIGNIVDKDNTIILPMPGTGNGKKDSSEIISGFSSGFYITRKAWDDPKKRDATVKFVMDMTSTEMIKKLVTAAGGGRPAADVGDLSGLTPLGVKGASMASQAVASDGAIDGWLSRPAWSYLLSKVVDIATGTDDSKAVVDQVIALNTMQ